MYTATNVTKEIVACVRDYLFLTDIASSSFLYCTKLGTSVDELLYQKSLQSTIPEAEELGMSVNLMDQKSFQEWMLDDDEGLFFYPMVRIQIFFCRFMRQTFLHGNIPD
jgi:hypothetical protein